jgi:hypothetical protein
LFTKVRAPVAAAPWVKDAPVKVSVAASAAAPAICESVAVAATAPPSPMPLDDNTPVVTPIVLLLAALASLKNTFSELAVNTCPPL